MWCRLPMPTRRRCRRSSSRNSRATAAGPIPSWKRPWRKRRIRNPPTKLHASLALLPVDASQVDYLFNRLLSATENELPVLRDALKTHQSTLTPKLWTVLETAKPGDAGLLPAASALASYSPDDARWESAGGKVAQAFVSVNSIYLGDWLKYLTDVRGKLTAPLATIFRDRIVPNPTGRRRPTS